MPFNLVFSQFQGTITAKYIQKVKADYKMVLKYLDQMRRHYGEDVDFACGYEAGPLGHKLYHLLNVEYCFQTLYRAFRSFFAMK
jgi:hypothetical protein